MEAEWGHPPPQVQKWEGEARYIYNYIFSTEITNCVMAMVVDLSPALVHPQKVITLPPPIVHLA